MFEIGTVQRGARVRPVKKKYLLNPFQNVVVGGTAFMQCDIGMRYHGILIPYSGGTMTPAHMTVYLKLNNEPVWSMTGARIDTINQFDGFPAAATYGGLYLNFERMGLIDHMKRYDTAINTGIACRAAPKGVTNMRLEIAIDGSAATPVLGPAIASVSAVNPDQGNFLLRRQTFQENVPANANVEFLFANKLNGVANAPNLTRLYIEETAANLSNIHFQTNGTDDVNITSAMNNLEIASYGIRKVNTSVVIYDTAADGNYNNYLRVGNAATFNVLVKDGNANAALPWVAETLGTLTA